ncbi:MAG: hypothetical protein ABSC50_05980 [Candidatus Bathyarchaeia archaeon]
MDATEFLTVIGISSILSSVVSIIIGSIINVLSEDRKFKREQNIAYLEEKLDKFYAPMMFHFENMKSWGAAWGEDALVYSGTTLADKLDDMKGLMRSGLRFASKEVKALWYDWQPYAVAAVHNRKGEPTYPWFSEAELQRRSRKLHDAVQTESQRLTAEYKRISKNEDY